ncbi:MAG: hypothetical protein N2314_06530 [Brevinematales bacterium]|nr:hypothetical protein [Brevinematales bacterium]
MKNISQSLFWFGFILLLGGLGIGILDREWSRFFFRNIYLDRQVVVGFHLFITHGHVLLFSVVSFVLSFLFKEETQSSLGTRVLFWVYVVGVVFTLSLGLYKGLSLSAIVGSDPRLGLFHADRMLFGGNVILRGILYTIAHPLLATGLIGLFMKASKYITKN